MHLKNTLTNTRRDGRFVAKYLQIMKGIVDQLAFVGAAVEDDDLVLHILNGLALHSTYKDLAAATRAPETSIAFEELHNKLVEFEQQVRKEESSGDCFILPQQTSPRKTTTLITLSPFQIVADLFNIMVVIKIIMGTKNLVSSPQASILINRIFSTKSMRNIGTPLGSAIKAKNFPILIQRQMMHVLLIKSRHSPRLL
ncbi:Uncharacterized protein TCM_029197 [Theobroma cacao]|uniref:Uncharacterized protein n=1 Tax=Theobroma cacao TaxID=3641 RepID=A0A061GD50_THECC|nr:Uncharacterized protein TCM_029197 [Theobroma cacao]